MKAFDLLVLGIACIAFGQLPRCIREMIDYNEDDDNDS